MPPYKRKMVPAAGFTPTKIRKYSNTAAVQRMRFSRTAFRSGQENNYVDLAAAVYAIDTTGSVTLINTVAQGTSVNQRVGKKYFMKSVQIRGTMYNNTAGVLNNAVCLLVYDKKPTGSLPAITDILVSASPTAFNNDNNTDRFRILRRWDEVLIGAPSATTGTEASAKNFDAYVKLNKPVICKAAGTGAIADIEEGALYFVTCGTNAAGTSAAATACGFRVRFSDM